MSGANQAMILAAGFGTRLGEIGKDTPKCLVEVGGKAIIEYAIDRLKAAGVKSLVINLHHLPDQVIEFFRKHKDFGLQVQFSSEKIILGTGGGILGAQNLIDKNVPFFLHNADIFCELNLQDLWQEHLQHKNLVTLAVTKEISNKLLVFDQNKMLKGWESEENKQQQPLSADLSRRQYIGIAVIDPRFFKHLSRYTGAFSLFKPILDAAHAGERIECYDIGKSYWKDCGTIDRLQEVKERIKSSR